MAEEHAPSPLAGNELDYLIEGGRRDLVSIGTVYQVLVRSQVYVLCNKAWDGKSPDPSLKTLLMKPEGEMPDMFPIFTDPKHAKLALEKYPDYQVLNQTPAALALTHCGGKVGLAINPGGRFDVQITPSGIDQLKQLFGPKPPQAAGSA